jgi:uncharacterized membrane protein
MSNQNNSQREISYTALSLAVGLIFGGLIGLLIGNPIIFAGGGLVLGLAFGAVLDNSG